MPRGSGGASSLKIDFADKLALLSATGVKLFGGVFVLCVAYVLYGVYGGHLRGQIDPRASKAQTQAQAEVPKTASRRRT